MRSLLALLALCQLGSALHFYLDVKTRKCFYEELPKDTLVVGHYTAELFDDHQKTWWKHDGIAVLITVDETFDNNHQVVNQRGSASGKFTFTAADSGDHRICFTPFINKHSRIRMTLDVVISETSAIESSDKGKLDDLAQRVKDLNTRLNEVRREQVFQREREADFRDQSESTNARVVRWILIQLAVLGVTCAWQLSHLRSFFIKQKLT